MQLVNGDEETLPNGWITIPLLELFFYPTNDIVDGPFGSNLKTSDYTDSGVPILRVQNIERNKFINKNIQFISSEKADALSRHSYQARDIVLTKLGNPLGKACIVPDGFTDGIIVADLVRLRLEHDFVNKKFLIYAINGPLISRQLKENTKGTTRPRVTLGHIRNLPIDLPPRNEQNRIVEKIEELFSELDKGIEYLKIAQEQLNVYRQSVLKYAFEGKLTEEWREAHADQLETADQLLERIQQKRENIYQQQLNEWEEAVKTWEDNGTEGKKPNKPKVPVETILLTEEELLQLPQLPEGWCWTRVEALGEVQLGRQRSPKNRSRDYPTQYIRAANITEDGFDLTDVMDMEFKPYEFERYQLKYGDILLSEASGSADQAGKPALWRDQIPNCCFQNTVIRFQPICLSGEYMLNIFILIRFFQKLHLELG